jgi:hypothetical protein
MVEVPLIAGRERSDEPIDRLVREVEALKKEFGELTDGRPQAALTGWRPSRPRSRNLGIVHRRRKVRSFAPIGNPAGLRPKSFGG